jgi:hypothetical protein
MRTRSISISAAALLASAALGAVAAHAADQTDISAAGDYNTENGVHAAPSGHVSEQSLATVGKITKTPAAAGQDSAPAAHVIKIAAREPAPSSLNWLSQNLAAARPGVVLPVAAEAPAPAQADAPAPAPADAQPAPAPLAAADAPNAPAVAASASAAPAAAVQVADSAPSEAAPSQLADAKAGASADTSVDALVDASANEQVADAEAPPAGQSEEAAVYRLAPADRDATPSPQPIVERLHDQPRDGQGMGHVAFPRDAAEAAGAFDGYMHAVAAIDAGFTSGQGVAEALQKASAYNARQLEEGMIAYGAMAAMQSARFVYGVMDIAGDAGSREDLAERLRANPEAAARLPGAREAAALAVSAIQREARPVVVAGHAIKQASYDVQHQSWSIARATDPRGRLAQAKALSQTPVAPREGDVARVIRQISDLDQRPDAADGGITPVAAHSLALAALAILDEAGGSDPDRLEPVTTEQISAQCLKMAKLNLFQCLSVAGPEYEDIYCLGQHAVLDTGQCVAGGASPREGAAMMSYARARE